MQSERPNMPPFLSSSPWSSSSSAGASSRNRETNFSDLSPSHVRAPRSAGSGVVHGSPRHLESAIERTSQNPGSTNISSLSLNRSELSPLRRERTAPGVTENPLIGGGSEPRSSQLHSLQTASRSVSLAVDADRALTASRTAGQSAEKTPGLFERATRYGGDVVQYLHLLQLAESARKGGIAQVGAEGQQHLLNGLLYETALQGASKLGYTAAELSELAAALRTSGVFGQGVGTVSGAVSGGVSSTVAGSVSGAGSAAASAGSGVSGAAGSAASSTSTAASMGAAASRVLGAAGAAYSLYSIYKNWGQSTPAEGAVNGAATGAYIGSVICPGVGTVVGGFIGAAVGALAGLVKKSGKDADQQARDQVREFLQENQMISQSWKVRLADGSGYDIGGDGNTRLPCLDGRWRRAFDVDFSHPYAGETVALVAPYAVVLLGGKGKLTDDFTGYLTNAALSNADNPEEVRANVQAITRGMRFSANGVQQGLDALLQHGQISHEEYSVLSRSVERVSGDETGAEMSSERVGEIKTLH